MRETWIPLVVCVGGATVTALVLISPFAAEPVGLLLFLGSVVVGCALVLTGTAASRRMVERAASAVEPVSRGGGGRAARPPSPTPR